MKLSTIETFRSGGAHGLTFALPIAFAFLSAVTAHAGNAQTIITAADSITPETADTLHGTQATQADTLKTETAMPTSAADEAENGMTAATPDTAATAHELSKYERNRERRIKGWSKLIPNQGGLQYAGSIGLLNVSIGWHYGRGDHWETDILMGFLPKYNSEKAHFTFTLKERYVPWHCHINERWTVEPLTAGIFFNTISGDDFWSNQPDRYPKKYYNFSTRIRTNVFLGQRLRFNIPPGKRVIHQALSVYYEISSCDLYIVSKAVNKDFPWRETLSLALGIRWEM